MNFQAKITPTGTELLKEKAAKSNGPRPVTDREISATIHPDDALPGGSMEAKPAQVIPLPARDPNAPLKVAIVGTAPSSRLLAPFSDPSWTIWVCSPGNMNTVPRADAWFEIHANLLWPECRSYGEPYVTWLRQQTFPVYMQDNKLVQNATPFPKEELIKEFGPYFFTSSFAWMIAFAIKQGATEIAMFGVDMASKDEYILQRAGGYYFMQIAASRGIKVSIPYESDLAQPPPLYGYSEVTPFGRKVHVRMQELKDRIAHMTNERDKLSHQITYLQGALEDADYFHAIWGGAQG